MGTSFQSTLLYRIVNHLTIAVQRISNIIYFLKIGPLAQLAERFYGIEEVIGSNPIWSTVK